MWRAFLTALVVSPCFAQTNTPDNTPVIPPQKEVVVVTGTFEPIPLEEADRNVDVFTVNGGRLLYDSFADYLKLDSSVDMQERAPNTVQSDISIRGYVRPDSGAVERHEHQRRAERSSQYGSPAPT